MMIARSQLPTHMAVADLLNLSAVAKTTEGSLAIENPGIKPGVKITLADQPGEHFMNQATPLVDTATVVELLSQDCDNNKKWRRASWVSFQRTIESTWIKSGRETSTLLRSFHLQAQSRQGGRQSKATWMKMEPKKRSEPAAAVKASTTRFGRGRR